MADNFSMEAIANIVQIVILVIVLISTIRILRDSSTSMSVLFFSLAVFSMIIIDIYWLAYDILRPGVRMPFAANEFGEAAMFLLFASVITSLFGKRLRIEPVILIPCIVFTAASVGLWIGWSGEWLQDIFTGVVFGYLICVVVMAAKAVCLLSKIESYALCFLSFCLVSVQAVIFIVPESIKHPLDLCCYLLMFTILTLLLAKCIVLFRRNADPEKLIAAAFLTSIWTVSTMYMSSGNWYLAAYFAETASILMMFLAVRKEVEIS